MCDVFASPARGFSARPSTESFSLPLAAGQVIPLTRVLLGRRLRPQAGSDRRPADEPSHRCCLRHLPSSGLNTHAIGMVIQDGSAAGELKVTEVPIVLWPR